MTIAEDIGASEDITPFIVEKHDLNKETGTEKET